MKTKWHKKSVSPDRNRCCKKVSKKVSKSESAPAKKCVRKVSKADKNPRIWEPKPWTCKRP
jgi:hypothetical protein